VLAQRISTLLNLHGIPAGVARQRSFDHEEFIPLKWIYFHADIPVLQWSLPAGLNPAMYIDLEHEKPSRHCRQSDRRSPPWPAKQEKQFALNSSGRK